MSKDYVYKNLSRLNNANVLKKQQKETKEIRTCLKLDKLMKDV